MRLSRVAVALLASFVVLGLSCDPDCPGYPIRYEGTMSGDFTATVVVNRVSGAEGHASYTGTFSGTGAFAGTTGVAQVEVECATQVAEGSFVVQDVQTDIPAGNLHGTLSGETGTGTYECSSHCTWMGDWDLTKK